MKNPTSYIFVNKLAPALQQSINQDHIQKIKRIKVNFY